MDVTISLLNANESPEFGDEDETSSENLTSKSIAEIGETSPTYVSEYSASDHEDTANTRTDQMEWSVSGPDSSQFEFNSNNQCTGDSVRAPTGTELNSVSRLSQILRRQLTVTATTFTA